MRKARKQAATPEKLRTCDMPGCGEDGAYKAPRSKQELREYYWFCLTHVRDYNKAWDYFSGMSTEEIETFMKDAVTGHRPTWKINDNITPLTPELLEEHLARMFEERRRKQHENVAKSNRYSKEHKALAVLDITPPTTKKDIKARYKVLVKKHHPDLNLGNKQSEETFKKLTEAYKFLMDNYKELL